MRFLVLEIVVLVIVLGGLAFAQALAPQPSPAGEAASIENLAATPAVNLAPDLPPSPTGKTTVIGGAIRTVDRLQDKLTLFVYGARDMKILFDERTEVYRGGQRVSLSDLKAGERVSVETLLDGEAVFARSIHMLSQSIDGDCRGQVLSFDRDHGLLSIRDNLAPDPIRVQVSAATSIVGQDQQALSASNLLPGSLVSATFRPDGNGRAVAGQIVILASPGTNFVFTGTVDFLDLHSGLLVLLDPRDQKRYEISFNPRLPGHESLREGVGVTVTAGFDGSRYKARDIAVNAPAPDTNDR
jgi:hypothetical protein